MSRITTQHLIGDIEALRRLHGVDRWLVFGGSWGSTLALAYAVEHASRVSELVLWGVTTTTRHEVDWLTWSMGEIYPEAFAELLALVPDLERGGNLLAATAWGVPLYIAEAFGFRKILDATFMIGFLVNGDDVSKADIDKYLAALRHAQMDIDLHPEACKHHHLRAVPTKYRDQVDVRAFSTGQRIVFLPYTQEDFASTQRWTQEHQLFTELPQPSAGYDEAALA